MSDTSDPRGRGEEVADDLEALALDIDIGSREQLSTDQLTRSRLQFALGQNASIIQQTRFADAKAATLLALTGVLAYGFTGEALRLPPVLLSGVLGLTGAVIALCLLAVMPRRGSGARAGELCRRERFSWPALIAPDYGADDHAAFLRTSQASHLVVSIARSNAAIAAVLARKYALLRAALWLALLDLAVILGIVGLKAAAVT